MNTSHELVDIQTINVDRTLPKEQRIIEYIRQIKNPYHFISNGIQVTTAHDSNGPSFEDCLRRLMA